MLLMALHVGVTVSAQAVCFSEAVRLCTALCICTCMLIVQLVVGEHVQGCMLQTNKVVAQPVSVGKHRAGSTQAYRQSRETGQVCCAQSEVHHSNEHNGKFTWPCLLSSTKSTVLNIDSWPRGLPLLRQQAQQPPSSSHVVPAGPVHSATTLTRCIPQAKPVTYNRHTRKPGPLTTLKGNKSAAVSSSSSQIGQSAGLQS